MKIAIDISPLKGNHSVWHRVRGTGFYMDYLKNSLLKFYPENDYFFFSEGEKYPKDVNILHIPYFEPFFLTLPLSKRNKTIVTIHDLTPLVFPEFFPAGLKGSFKWQIQKKILKRADAIITDSESSKRDIVKYTEISDKKIYVVYLAAGEEFKRIQDSKSKIQNLRRKYNLPEKFLLYVGDITWNKNLPRLISAIKQTHIPLVMVGKALVEKNFDQTNRWNQDMKTVQGLTEDNKQFFKLGFIPKDDLVALYNIATIFVMPSLYEGFGLPILEAMSCGCPVITSKEGSLAEVADKAAYFTDPYSVEAIRNSISILWKNESFRKKLIIKGIKQAHNFSWRKVSSDMMEVYKNIAGHF